jgi:hypothetical protein
MTVRGQYHCPSTKMFFVNFDDLLLVTGSNGLHWLDEAFGSGNRLSNNAEHDGVHRHGQLPAEPGRPAPHLARRADGAGLGQPRSASPRRHGRRRALLSPSTSTEENHYGCFCCHDQRRPGHGVRQQARPSSSPDVLVELRDRRRGDHRRELRPEEDRASVLPGRCRAASGKATALPVFYDQANGKLTFYEGSAAGTALSEKTNSEAYPTGCFIDVTAVGF